LKNKEIEMLNFYFFMADESLQYEFIIQDDKLISNCKEDYWKSLLIKTMNGFKYFLKSDYDLVFKTNLSSVINFDIFLNYCNTNTNEDLYTVVAIGGNTGTFEYCQEVCYSIESQSN
jgi:hypothetical protein